MKYSFVSLLAGAALVACAPGPDGADGAAGVQGAQGAQGVQGEPGAPGADAPAREGTIVSVTTGPVVAGGSVEMHVMGQYTEWTEAPTITTEYEGLSVSTVVTSPVVRSIARMAWLPVSATYRVSPSNASPCGPSNAASRPAAPTRFAST